MRGVGEPRRVRGLVAIASAAVVAATVAVTGCLAGGRGPGATPATASITPMWTSAATSPAAGSSPTVGPSASRTVGPSASASAVHGAPSSLLPTTPAVPTAPVGAPPVQPAVLTAKKGVSTWYFDRVQQAMGNVGASWYYTWAAGPEWVTAPAGVEFVPMTWGANSVNQQNLDLARRSGQTLLGFNEPDLGSQANMPVERALELWPSLAATGMRLGSPAVASGGADAGGWLDRFMGGAADWGYRVDFIALHWYGSDFDPVRATGQLRSYLQAVHDRYGLPIWLTEYGLTDFSGPSVRVPAPQGQAAFVTASTAMLEGLPFVERYAWFSLPATGDSRTGLYDAAGVPTPAGVAYRQAGADSP